MPAVPTPGLIFNQQFELLEILGSGGVSTVYKAKQLDLGRLVALKILHSVELNNDKFKERFLSAVKVLSEFSHSGIVKVYQFGESDTGMAYASMEFVDGISLRKLLKGEGRLPTLRAIKIAEQIADLMETAHAHGMLHRDLKPDNIILLDKPARDTAKIVDFAFAYIDEADRFIPAGKAIVGSPRYISPEQGGGKQVDARADIYSLSVCLFEMLTGRKPFSANNSALLLYKHLNDPVPQIQPGQIDRFLPTVNDLISKGMAKQPTERYQSMKELSQALAALSAALQNVKAVVVAKQDTSAANTKAEAPLKAIAGVAVIVLLALFATAVVLKPEQRKRTEAEFYKYKNERKRKTIAFLEADVRRLERKKHSPDGNDPDYLRNLSSRLRTLSEAQQDSGDLPAAERSIIEAINLFSSKAGDFSDIDVLTGLKGQHALIKIQAKDYKDAGEILQEAQQQVERSSAVSGGKSSYNKKEACLIPARLGLNIRLHKFDLAAKDLMAAFELSHSADKDFAIPAPPRSTAKFAWALISTESFNGTPDKLAALSFIDLLIDKLLDSDKDLCKAPMQKATTLLLEIPEDTPVFASIAERTKALAAKYEGLQTKAGLAKK